MIHLLGHNSIVINLAKTLSDWNVPFKVYSNIEIDITDGCFVRVENPDRLVELLEEDSDRRLILSAGAPWILNKSFLLKFEPEGILNIHGTPLPHDRGGTIASWLILNKKRIGLAAIHKMVSEPDAGPILMTNEFIYPSSCYYPKDYIEEYNSQQFLLAKALCIQWQNGEVNLMKHSEQPHYLSSYWPRLSSNLNAWINWDWEGEEIELFIRAFDKPYKGAMSTWRGVTVYLSNAFFQKDANYHPFQWGLVYRIRKINKTYYIAIVVRGGTLYVQSCLDGKGKDMIEVIKEGDRIYHTDDKLNSSKRRTIKRKTGLYSQSDLI